MQERERQNMRSGCYKYDQIHVYNDKQRRVVLYSGTVVSA